MKILLLFIVSMITLQVYAQTATVTAGDVSALAADSVIVPINVQNFVNVGAITIKIQYTPSVLSWGRALNWDPQLAGALANASNGVATIAWDAIAGMNLSDGKLVDLKFLFNGGSTVMDFLEGQCEIADVNGNIISTTYINGSVNQSYINVTSPNGGESWVSGNQYNITWADNIDENVKIELYKAGSFNSTIIGSTPSNGAYSWTIPIGQATGSDYKVRITSVNIGTLYDESNNNFTISQPTITVTEPPAGATWTVGSNQPVSWSSTYITGNVNIKLSTDGGTSFPVTLTSNTANDGTEIITVPNNVSATCRVKVESVTYPSIFGVNPGNFEIVPAPYINVTSPNGGENWISGNQYSITWADNIDENVKIELYKAGSFNSTIIGSTPSSGAYSWTIPISQMTGSDYKVRITSINIGTLYDESNNNFTISQPTITVTEPPAGATWTVESNQPVSWSSTYITGNVNIKLSTDGGTSFPVTLTSNTANDGTEIITVPNNVSTTCRVKVEWVTYPIIFGINPGNFEIVPAPYINVTTPNGGENWVSGNQYSITWADIISENVKIELYKGGVFNSTIIGSTPSNGTYSWTIPISQATGSDYKVRITSVNTGSLYDESNNNFTINEQNITVTKPIAGEVWITGTNDTILWISNNVTGNVSISLSTDGGLIWVPIISDTPNDGIEIISVPPGSSTCKIKVASVSNPSVFGISENFIINQQLITITSPNGGENWVSGNQYSITWTDNISENVKIDLYKGGVFNSTIIGSTPSNETYSWTIPISQATGSDYKVRITSVNTGTLYDESNSNFTIADAPTITVVSPNGGEIWCVGTIQNIIWQKSGATSSYVNIDYSSDSGINWIRIFTQAINDGNQNWTIPGSVSSHNRIKITDYDNPSIYDISDGDFSIVTGVITVISPDCNEVWNVGTAHSILWTSECTVGPNVKISFKRSTTSTWATIISSTPNDGSFDWSIPAGITTGDDYQIKVEDITNSTIFDVSCFFTISGQTFQLTVNVNDGWNMVSVPGLNPLGQGVEFWWPGREGQVFRFNNGYQIVTTTTPGEGYWMKNNGAQTYNTGDEWPAGGIQIVAHDPIAGASGWNLIGGYELSVTAANVTTNPPGLQSEPIFGYSNGYYIASTIDPGYAYWIKLTGGGQIIIPETLAKDGKPVEYFAEDWGRIILTDATGINYTLYAVKGQIDLSQYELPPAPPEGMFDIRYESGRIAEDINSSVKTIDMSGVTYPLTVKVEGMDIKLQDETGKQIIVNVKSGEEITISDATIRKLLVSKEIIPDKYLLEQNYPNPFNPSTVIIYSVPKESKVRLSLFNILGEEVEVLVDGYKLAGKYFKFNK